MLTTARITDEHLAAMAKELAARLNRLAVLSDDPRPPLTPSSAPSSTTKPRPRPR